MRIIHKQLGTDGAHSQIYERDCTTPPDGCYQVADGVELSCGGFGTLTVEDGIVTAFTPDVEAWEAWQASLPTPQPPQPTETEKLRADVDFIAVMTGVTI